MTHWTIIVDDKAVYKDGAAVVIEELDWTRFNGDPGSPWDDIHAVQFDGKQGHVSYKTVTTGQVTRPDMTPPDWRICAQDWDDNFAWVVPIYEAKKVEIEARRAAEAARAAELAALAHETPPQPVTSPLPADAVTKDDLAASEADKDAKIAALEARVNEMLETIAASKGAT